MIEENTETKNINICPKCNKRPNRQCGYCKICKDKERLRKISESSPLKKCECSPECPELIHSISLAGKPAKVKKGHTVKGDSNPNWKGGRFIDFFGYVRIKLPDHPNCNPYGYVREHRWVMEQHIGRYLTNDEDVHHINGIKDDNRIENLELIDHAEHTSHHKLGNILDKSDRICYNCKSNKTYISRPCGPEHKTANYSWCHLPWDKENWYCKRCYDIIARGK